LIEMKLEGKITALIAVGASIAANCAGCLEKTVCMAKEAGAGEEEIGEAVEIGRRVRAGAANKLDQLATTLNRTASSPPPAKSESCALHRLIRRARNTTPLDGCSGGE
jgi:hypothetical protein